MNGSLNLLELWISNPSVLCGSFLLFSILDIKLTRLGFSLSQKEYKKHFKHEIYELNPLHQEAIHKQQPIKKRTYIIWFLIFILLLYTSDIYVEALNFGFDNTINLVEFFIGGFFWIDFEILSVHVKGLMQYRFLNKFPTSVKGETEISPEILYETNKGNLLAKGFLVLCVYLLIEEVFFLGGFFGILYLWGLTFLWKRKAIKS